MMRGYWWTTDHTDHLLPEPKKEHYWIISLRLIHASCSLCQARVIASPTECTTSCLWIDTMITAARRILLCFDAFALDDEYRLFNQLPVVHTIRNDLLHMCSRPALLALVTPDCQLQPLLH